MKNIDCEIYTSQLISFFENNPNDLLILIGDLQKQDFYNKLREQCEKNLKENGDHVITKQQLVDIIIGLKIPKLVETEESIEKIQVFVQKSKWGDIILN